MTVPRKLKWKPDPNQSGSKVLWCDHCNQEARPRVTHGPMKRHSPKKQDRSPTKAVGGAVSDLRCREEHRA
jgi:hypothetical protein